MTPSLTVIQKEPGDVHHGLSTLPDKSVHCCITSPPYFGLRDYKTESHLWPEVKYKPMSGCSEIVVPETTCCLGNESAIEEYVAHMVLCCREIWRVLRDDGAFWLNLGDSYTNSGKSRMGDGTAHSKPGDKQFTNRGSCAGIIKVKSNFTSTGIRGKNLIGVPWRVAFALQADGWILRSDIIWAKPNCMPESVTDRPTRSHEYIFLLTKSPKYYYNHEAIKEQGSMESVKRLERGVGDNHKNINGAPGQPPHSLAKPRLHTDKQRGHSRRHAGFNDRWDKMDKREQCTGMRNKRDVWTITVKGYQGAHFATFPPTLVHPMILASTSEKGCCPQCGAPWMRTVGKSGSGRTDGYTETVGWQQGCQCRATEPVPCTVLDLFGGSGTTGMVAIGCGQNAILTELQPDYIPLINARCAPENVAKEMAKLTNQKHKKPKMTRPKPAARKVAIVVKKDDVLVDKQIALL